ncbi:MAG: hypothetical protein QJR14_05640 [Bacillota bacterium]|nr:hypothetical protein [Bacillota bacterium]
MSRSMKLIAVITLVAALGGGVLAGALLTGTGHAAGLPAPVAQTVAQPSWVDATTPAPGQAAPGAGPAQGAGHGRAWRMMARGERSTWINSGPAVVAKELGMTVQELIQARQSGQSVAQIAQSKGVSLQSLIDAVLAAPKAALDVRVQQGVLTAQERDRILTELQQRLETNFQRTTLGRPGKAAPPTTPQTTPQTATPPGGTSSN